jgi:hypothetical protein
MLQEYIQYAKELLKDSAAIGDWICVTCRDILKARASTFGADVNGVGKVRATLSCMILSCVSTEVVALRTGVGDRSTA